MRILGLQAGSLIQPFSREKILVEVNAGKIHAVAHLVVMVRLPVRNLLVANWR